MKSRTKWLFCLCLLAWLSTGCDSKSDITSKDPPGAMNTEWKTYYTYKNASSHTVKMYIVSVHSNTGEGKEKSVTIRQGEQYDLIHNFDDTQDPLNLLGVYQEKIPTAGRVTVSNGTVEVYQRKWAANPNNLYSLDSYERTEEKEYLLYITRYTYTFTDDFFMDGTPIGEKE